MFSTADEYEHALIAKRRAEGRYAKPGPWPLMMFIGCSMIVAGTVLLAS